MPRGVLPWGYQYQYDENGDLVVDSKGNAILQNDILGGKAKTYDQFDPTGWGGKGSDITQYGSQIGGTDGANEDVDRYREMAGRGRSAPRVDQEQANESRRYSSDAIAQLERSADGTDPSGAVLLGRQQTSNAMNNMQSMANSARGGAGARAAAGRAAQMNRASLASTGYQQEQATRAGEMATARGALMDASSKQRGLDTAVATEQAKLDAQQRQQNAQREQYFERLGWETTNSQLGAKLGRTAAEQAAANAAKAQQLSEDQQSWNNQKTAMSMGMGAVQGGISAYGASQSDPTKDPNKTGSDERMKDDILPLMDHPDGRLLQQGADGRSYYASLDEPNDGRPSLAGPTPRLGTRRPAQTATEKTEPPKSSEAPKKAKPRLIMPKRVKSIDEQVAELEAQMSADHTSRMQQGPAVGPESTYALSDKKTKSDRGEAPMAAANRSLAPSVYEYKDGFTPMGQTPREKNVGPMANNMARDPIASTAIIQDPETGLLAINKEKGLKLALGGIASLQSEVDALKQRKAS